MRGPGSGLGIGWNYVVGGWVVVVLWCCGVRVDGYTETEMEMEMSRFEFIHRVARAAWDMVTYGISVVAAQERWQGLYSRIGHSLNVYVYMYLLVVVGVVLFDAATPRHSDIAFAFKQNNSHHSDNVHCLERPFYTFTRSLPINIFVHHVQHPNNLISSPPHQASKPPVATSHPAHPWAIDSPKAPRPPSSHSSSPE
jgi:hypothetical protein